MLTLKWHKSIKITILIHFMLLSLITASALIGIQSYFNHQYAQQTAHQNFQHLFERIEIKNKILDQQSRALLNFIEEYPAITNLSHDLTAKKNRLHILAKTLSHFPEAYALYIGYADGQFFEVINMAHRQDLWQQLDAPKEARWGLVEVIPEDGDQAYQYRFYNEALQLIAQRATTTNYVPSERPWYQDAIQRSQVVKSNPYLFWHLKAPGITYSKRVKSSDSVLAVDYTIDHLTELFEEFKPTPDSYVTLFNEAGQKILETGSQQALIPLPKTQPLSMSASEQALVESTPELKISNQLNWAPYDFVRNG